MTDVQVNPDGRLQHSDAQQTGKGNKVKPIRFLEMYVRIRASTEAKKSRLVFLLREKQINASWRREEPPPIDLSSRFRRRDAATPRRSLLTDSIVAEASTSRVGRPNEWPDCFQTEEKFGM